MTENLITNSPKKTTGSYLRVKDHILNRFRVGDKLPNEEQLTRELGITQYAAMKGLSELAAEGLVQREKGKGSFLVSNRRFDPGKVSRTVAFLADEFESIMSVEILRGIEEYFRPQSLGVTLLNSDFDPMIESSNLTSLSESGYAGAVVILGEHPKSLKRLEELADQGFPVVQVDRYEESLDLLWVAVDHEQAAYDAVNYLIGQGHRKIAHITFCQNVIERLGSALQRKNGYLRALKEAEIPFNPEYIQGTTIFGPDQKPSPQLHYLMAYEPMHKLLSLPDPPTAVFLLNDDFAPGAFRAIENHGLKVPHDVSLMGFNNDPLAEHLAVPLTTMAQPFRQIGRTSAELLNALISGETPAEHHVRLDGELVIRESVRAL